MNGTLSIDISGTASYTPNPNFCGNDIFQYRAYDQFSSYADPVTAKFSVNCVNDPPVAVNDSYTETGLTLDINPMLNDTDVDSPYVVQTFSLSGFTQPIHGIVIQTGGILNYTPNLGYI